MTGDREAELAVLHARIRDRVDTSKKLVASVRDRARDHRDRALTGFTAAERQLDHIADGLPALYRLAATPEKDGADDLFGVVLAAARSVYPGCDATSVTTIAHSVTLDEHWPVTAAATGLAASLDTAQYGFGEGPLVDAVELKQIGTVLASDLEDEEVRRTWPRFSRIARRSGIRAVISIGLPWVAGASRPVVAAVTVYAADPATLAAPEARGLVLGSWAGALLSGQRPAEVYDAIIWRPSHVPAEWSGDGPS